MAVTTGQVHEMTWSDSGLNVCVQVGPSPTDAEALFLILDGSPAELASKHSVLNLLSVAQRDGLRLSVSHSDTSGEITTVETETVDISPTGPAIRDDLFAVSGSGFPADARVVFDSATVTVQLVPAMVRPHLVVVESLYPGIPLGPNTVQVVGTGFASSVVPVIVRHDPPPRCRVLHSGPPLDATPYTIALVASPAYRQDSDGAHVRDEIVTDHPAFCDVVARCLSVLFNSSEELLRYQAMDRSMRLVVIVDPSRGVSKRTTLVEEDHGTIVAKQKRAQAFVADYGETADIVYAFSYSFASTPSGWPTEDDDTSPGTGWTFDDFDWTHRRTARHPGAIGLGRWMSRGDLTMLHEFGHAASLSEFGFLADLYNDIWTSNERMLAINRKWRVNKGDPVPHEYARLNVKLYLSDPDRDGLGYPDEWLSYHPQLRNSLPNMMDWNTSSSAGESLFDEITEQWLRDRLLWKIDR